MHAPALFAAFLALPPEQQMAYGAVAIKGGDLLLQVAHRFWPNCKPVSVAEHWAAAIIPRLPKTPMPPPLTPGDHLAAIAKVIEAAENAGAVPKGTTAVPPIPLALAVGDPAAASPPVHAPGVAGQGLAQQATNPAAMGSLTVGGPPAP
ncbi:MAG: hypothetical protein ACYC6M_03060 [Terriglobales bacterium]